MLEKPPAAIEDEETVQDDDILDKIWRHAVKLGEVLRPIIILGGCVVTVLLISAIIEGNIQGVIIYYIVFQTWLINLVALILSVTWKQKSPIKWAAIILNGAPAILVFLAFFITVPERW